MSFAELVAATNYSFLRGASHPGDMVGRALELGMAGIGIADRNSVAGVVRAWTALNEACDEAQAAPEEIDFRLIVGARLVFADATPDIIAYPASRHGWGRLTRLLTIGTPFRYTIEVTAPTGVEVEMPQIGSAIGDFQVADFGQEPNRVGETVLGATGRSRGPTPLAPPENPQLPNPLHGDAPLGGDLHRSQRSGG